MLKKTITYTDYNGDQRTEDFYFNLSQRELTVMEASTEGGLSVMLQDMIDNNDPMKLIETFQKIVLMSYGEKSADGRRFVKSEALREEFSQTEAYEVLFNELSTDADAAAAFVNGILPQNLVNAANAAGGASQDAAQAVLQPAT